MVVDGGRAVEKRFSSYRGVFARKGQKTWSASIKHNCTKYDLGSFHDEEIAARAYDMASICSRRRDIKQHHLNFPLEQYTQVLPVLLSSSLPDFVAELKAELAHHRKRTQYHGVKMHSCGKWEAWLHFSPRRRAGAAASASPSSTMYIGIYETDRDAAMAVDQAQMLCFWKLYKEEGNSEESPKLNFPAEIYFPLCCTSSDPSTDNSIRITPLNDKQIERVLNVRDPEYDKN